jgi:thiamine-phosphate pyrophosphorylase
MSYKRGLSGLYAITDNKLTPNSTILENVEEALKGGANIIQLRDKQNDDQTIISHCNNLSKLCKKYNALFILNDRIDLAIKLKTDGLHIGRSDHDSFESIRRDFDGIIGVSCYGDIKLAKKFEKLGADYVAFGSFFTSSTKPLASVVPLEVLEDAKNSLNIPICAIGGISRENVNDLIKYQPDMVSVISDIFGSDNIKESSQVYTDLFKDKR